MQVELSAGLRYLGRPFAPQVLAKSAVWIAVSYMHSEAGEDEPRSDGGGSTTFDTLHDMLTCRPPLKRNWFPLMAAGAVFMVGAIVGAGMF